MLGAPHATEVLLPGDELLVLGTDEQIESARPIIELPDQRIVSEIDFGDYSLRPLRLKDASALVNQTVQSCSLREQFDALIVGIERDGSRILNPPPATRLLSGDTLWVVGPREKLSQLPQ